MVVVEILSRVFQVRVLRGPTIAEEGLVDFRTVNGERAMLGAVGAESAAVFVDEFITGWLVEVPNAAVAGVFLVKSQYSLSSAKAGFSIRSRAETYSNTRRRAYWSLFR